MRAYNLEHVVRRLESWGISDVLLPFLLIFIIFYSIFQKSKILGGKRGIDVGVSVAIGLIPVILHVTHRYPGQWDPIEIMKDAIPGVALIAVVMISLLILSWDGADMTLMNHMGIP